MHLSTDSVLWLIVTSDSEKVTNCESKLSYLHRGLHWNKLHWNKFAENRNLNEEYFH